MAASTVFVMLYVGAVAGSGRYLAPKQVYAMTDKQAQKRADAERLAYAVHSLRPRFHAPGKRWYADTTREPIRDETLRDGLIPLGGVIARRDLATTSSKPRYTLERDFAQLFDPTLAGDSLTAEIKAWRSGHLTPSALARLSLVARGVVQSTEGVLVTFPNQETRRMASGPSSIIAKAVIEDFAARFLSRPGVIWLSESGAKVVKRDDELARELGLEISAEKNLPDVILVDLGPQDPFLVFVEIVATAGAITALRQAALLQIARRSVFRPERIAFVTAYLDRNAPAFRRSIPELAWRSIVWFASEPDHLMVLHEGGSRRLALSELFQ